MKKNLLFIFLLMLFLVPSKVKGETFYFNHGEYNYSNDVIEERKDLEVQTIIENGNTIYKYRTRDYLIIPSKIVVNSKEFDYLSLFDTNLLLDDILLEETYNLDEVNNCYGNLLIRYGSKTISKSVYIEIQDYINVPEEIIVSSFEFNIWDYIDTNILKEEIAIEGEYDLYINGEYEVTLMYRNISKKLKLIVDIEENKIVDDEELVDNNPSNDIEEVEKDNTTSEEIIVEEEPKQKIEEFNTYVNNYYQTYESSCEKEIEYVDRIVPVNNKVNCKDTDYNKQFRYISYVFYGVTTILLSIIVVRKK